VDLYVLQHDTWIDPGGVNDTLTLFITWWIDAYYIYRYPIPMVGGYCIGASIGISPAGIPCYVSYSRAVLL
jgi:hypothetical protein